jgi:hypothetical protein
MRLFQDTKGRSWEIAVDIGTVKRVRRLVGFELLSIVEDEGRPIIALRDDPEKLFNVVYAICEPQIVAEKVTQEDFGRSVNCECLENAWDLIFGAMTDFFSKGRRQILAAAAIQAGITIQANERVKLSLLGGVPPKTCGTKSSPLQAVRDWLLGPSPGANCRG